MLKLSKKMKHISIFFLIVMLIFSLTQTALATEKIGSITLSYRIAGAEFSLYKVGSVNSQGYVALFDEYSDYGVDLESENLAATLASYVLSDNKQPLTTAVTDESCVANFDNIPEGVYLITGSTKVVNNVKYTALPILVSVPLLNTENNESLMWDIDVNGKCETVAFDAKKNITVLKVWKNDGNENSHPVEVSVSLTKNGEIYDTVTLNSDNNWKHRWMNLTPEDQWAVIENNVPNDFKVNIQKNSDSFVVTNTYQESDEPNKTDDSTPNVTPPPNKPALPQTGQLWWPVCVLVFVGLSFIFIGIIRRRKNVQNDN